MTPDSFASDWPKIVVVVPASTYMDALVNAMRNYPMHSIFVVVLLIFQCGRLSKDKPKKSQY